MKYFWRMPAFPILLDTGTELIVLRGDAECDARLAALSLSGRAPLPVIDATVEGFAYYPDLGTITPLTVKKHWTKAEIIALYDARRGPGTPAYTRSLPNRTLAAVVSDIARLLAGEGS